MRSSRITVRLGALALVIGVLVLGTLSAGQPVIRNIRLERGARTTEGIGELVSTSRACQTFRAEYDGLAQVQVRLDDLGRENSGPFHFALRASPDAQEDLVSLTHDASTVEQDTYHTFPFPRLPDSAGQTFAFCLEAPEAGLDNSITAIGTLEDSYPGGQAEFRDMWGAQAGVQDLDFYLGYRLPFWVTVDVLLDRLTANKPFLCGMRWFYILLGAVYLALLYALTVRFVPQQTDSEDRA